MIYIRATLGPIAHRCTLAHEIGHLELGPPTVPECPINEAETVGWTARWLLPDVEPVARLLVDLDLVTAARALGVTRVVLSDRLQRLDDVERAALECGLAGAAVAA